ncbi:hypothetical protein [Streptacidiphilus sp. PAMC 29251]
MMILVDRAGGDTLASLQFWRETHDRFGTFVEARAYLSGRRGFR